MSVAVREVARAGAQPRCLRPADAVAMADVLAVLAQVRLDCRGHP